MSMRKPAQEANAKLGQNAIFLEGDKITRKSNPAIEKKTFPFTEKELLKGLTPITAHADLLNKYE